jgi:secondary thiamine-phosphate synthase enzyme
MHSLTITTFSRAELVDITARVQHLASQSGIRDGRCHVWVPHTTAGLTINENADPDVARDLLAGLDRIAPWNAGYTHGEGNSAAHIKSSLVGCEKTLIIKDGQLALGTWQGLFFCEFDGPRQRQVWIKIVEC